MSDFDSNPFADPELNNPFQDPSVTQVRQTAPPGLEEYNPFTDAKPMPAGMAPKTGAPTINTQPAIMKPTEEPPAYSQPQAQEQSRGAAELLRRQEELERKAAELDRREREMQSLSASGGRKNNWPPLPEKLPVGPCFYHDITVDIPVEFQKTVKIMYYLWMFHTGTLLANMVGCLAWFCVDASRGVDFGLSIVWFMLFTPCSFVCWYRPLYGAFRSDSSFSGWISALTGLNRSIPVGIIMILIAALFTSLAVMSLIMFKKVHAMYRTTGASFERAQQEFATGVMSNKTVQTAAATAASRAAQGTFKEQI
ncbi:secretory carrier-associated membrane protein 1-like isoform X3 [Siniperca chuatsi]|uniref:secretory carrier-associated membrane protein 1-like isoform X3 n=1 Tax=Siniperca chuatsi TaxID=119488 RepID=UPI001CE1380A|nr:secretory carrier-associated membrane protein 1-like isoform X3 [Siniperca chuatsi]